jgi:eukaryotic-like serine/threonine-protein kinase
MALSAGAKLGPYEIQSPLGAGGMGEVYRARDTRLDRNVAIKILPSHLSDDPEAKQRFDREARSISSLNHPNICTLHDVGHQDGIDYLVMEYVQGETLESRLQKGPLPLKQALDCGMQVCDALEKAHRAGIVHRDLKPGNIMLTASGAKLLDFGLAKPGTMLASRLVNDKDSLTPSTPTMNLSMLSATPAALTQRGMIVGTFQYMAPEILQGGNVDARSDVFSFGCVLYEMITGRRAFEGKSQLSVMTAILEQDPEPVSKTQPLAPAGIDHVVMECLAKDPESRWQSAADIGRQLRWIATSGSGVSPVPSLPRRSRLSEHLVWVAVVAVLASALLWSNLHERSAEPTLRAFLPPPADTGFDIAGDFSGPPTLSPDGTAVAFCARNAKNRNAIWVQSLSSLTATKLEGTDAASFPFWSADGKFLGFFADGHLKKVPSGGGPVTVLAEAPNGRGGTWNRDNVIVYEPDYRDSLWRISASGGSPAARLTKIEGGEHTTHRWPVFLPDGKHFLFFGTNHSGDGEEGIYFGSLQDGSFKRVLSSDSQAQYASGYLLYHFQSQLLAQAFDPDKGVASGDAAAVASTVEYDSGTWHATFTVSQNGLLVYEPGSKALGSNLYWVDRSGKIAGQVAEPGAYKGCGELSPDGKRLAVSLGDPQADVWVFDLARGSRTRLTFGGATHLMPSWSPDGQRVVYVKQKGATIVTGTSICSRLANGGGQEEVLLEGNPGGQSRTLLSPQWSADARYVIHTEQSGPGGNGVWALAMTGDRKPIPMVQAPAQTRIADFRLSPNGRWLAYTSTESGREEVYVTHFPSGAGKWQVSQAGAAYPAWRGDSREIFFVGLDGALDAGTVNPDSNEFELEPVHSLFQTRYVAAIGKPYDVVRDGQRFLFEEYPESVPTPLVLVTNWAGELSRK